MPKIVDRVEIQDYDESEELLENIENGRNKSACGTLIIKINEYLKKPSIDHDLSGILTTYLQVLQNDSVYMQNGICRTNFAEAALILNYSTQLYGKKVDLFWDEVIEYLSRNMSYEEKTDENKDQFALLEEQKDKFKRKRRILENEEENKPEKRSRKKFVVDKASANIQGMNFDDFRTFLNSNSTAKTRSSCYEDNWSRRSADSKHSIVDNKLQHGNTLPADNSHEKQLVANMNSITYHGPPHLQYDLLEENIYGTVEPMGDYGSSSAFDQINREFISQHRQVHRHNIADSQVSRDNVQDTILQQWLTEKQVHIEHVYAKIDEFNLECKKAEEGLCVLKTTAGEEGNKLHAAYDAPGAQADQAPNTRDPFDSLLPDRICDSPSLKSISPFSDQNEMSEIGKELGMIMGKINDTIRTTIDSDIESGVFDASSTMTGCTPDKIAQGARTLSIFSEGIGMDAPLSPKESGIGSRACTPAMLDTATPILSPIEEGDETILEEVAVERCVRRARARKKLIEQFDDDGNEVVTPKRKRRVTEKMLPVLTANLKDFDKFFLQHYTPDDGEGELDAFEDDGDDDDDNDALGEPLAADDSALDVAASADSTLNTSDSFLTPESAPPASAKATEEVSAEEDSRPAPSSEPSSKEKSFTDIMCNDAATRLKHVMDWKKFIMDKINKRKTDFDIHVEETKVLESIGVVGKSVKYKDLCTGMPAAQISHNFLAMLHLVNTHNVQITGTRPGMLSNDTLEIKLLSTDRHHEHLDEYNAPSAETREEKLICINKALKRPHSREKYPSVKKHRVVSQIATDRIHKIQTL